MAVFALSFSASLLAAELHREKETQDVAPRFQVVRGKGWSVCERYARFLNAQPPAESPPLCHLQLSPEVKEPDWEVLDIQKHLNVIYLIEHPPYKAATNPDKPPPSFERWQQDFWQRQSEGQSPRLRRTHLALAEGGPVETILAYEADQNRCDRAVRENGYDFRGGGGGFALWNERLGKIDDYQSMLAFLPGTPSRLVLFHGRPFMVWVAWGNMSTTPQRRFEMRIGVHQFLYLPNMGEPYGQSERCQISFPLPSNIVERMAK